jgi:hypothetical protein
MRSCAKVNVGYGIESGEIECSSSRFMNSSLGSLMELVTAVVTLPQPHQFDMWLETGYVISIFVYPVMVHEVHCDCDCVCDAGKARKL